MSGLGWVLPESGSDGDWMVRTVPGERAGKDYRCPGCDHEIRPGIQHVVTWPCDAPDDRRHWHTACWSGRERRSPTRRR
ncbi:MAG TPA: hypothetical protein VHH34_21410 [Pseudonocardiaceae bacterium]|nr:hypothetical protein [Pseudonocardiaceae bacterium]